MIDKKNFLYGRVVTDLEKLIEDSDNVSKSGSGEYILDCPECLSHGLNGYSKLYITKDKLVGYCQRCKTKYINKQKDITDELVSIIKTPRFHYAEKNIFEIDKVDVEYYNYSKLESKDELAYLQKRNPELINLYKDLGFRFRKDKIVMPFYWTGEVIYYQIRFTINRDSISQAYFMPPIGHKPLWINPLNAGSDTLVLTEGIFGAIGAWLTYGKKFDTISIQGSYLTKYHIWMLSHFNYSRYLIYLDDIELSEHVKKLLIDTNPLIYSNIEIVESKFHDPEDDYLNKSVEH